MNLPSPLQTRAIVRAGDLGGGDVPHLSRDEVDRLIAAARSNAKSELQGERDSLLIALLFDAALRVTEVVGRSEKEAAQLTRDVQNRVNQRQAGKPGRPRKVHYEPRPGITMADFDHSGNGWQLRIIGKGNKYATVAVSASLVARLSMYANRAGIGRNDRLFPISRFRAFQILKDAYKTSGVQKPPKVGSVHVLRHAGAIDRLEQMGDPKAVQDQLRHSDARMTIRYLKTVSHKASLAKNQQIDNGW